MSQGHFQRLFRNILEKDLQELSNKSSSDISIYLNNQELLYNIYRYSIKYIILTFILIINQST